MYTTISWFSTFWTLFNLFLWILIIAAIVMGCIKGARYIKRVIKFIDKAERI